jgi:biotin transport system substrate-specific component
MSYGPSLARPVAELLWPASDNVSRALRHIALALLGCLLLWASAKMYLPFHPVPLNLQTAVIFLLGIAFGPRLGAVTVLLYLGLGALGVPVFSGSPHYGVGLPYIFGPTGGYLLGMIPAVLITGWVAARRSHWSETAGAILIATAAVYLFGITWLSGFVGWKDAMAIGMAPFMAGDFLKLVLVTVLSETGLAALQRRLHAA